MVNLAQVSDTQISQNIYLDRLIVYVEGEDDVEIFQRLIPGRTTDVLFTKPVEHDPAGDVEEQGGCEAVVRKVAEERAIRSNPDRCIGIVDRDIFFGRKLWDLLFEEDDDEYLRKHGLGDGIYPLTHWEIENFLIERTAVQNVLDDQKINSTDGAIAVEMATTRGMLITAANCLLHDEGVEGLGFRHLNDNRDDSEIKELILNELESKLEVENVGAKFDQVLEKLRVLCGPDVGGTAHIDRDIRGVEGKLLIAFLDRHFSLKLGLRLKLLLARNIGHRGVQHERILDIVGDGST